MPHKASVTSYRWDDMEPEPLNDLLTRRLITGEKVMVAQLHLKKGCVVPMHSHENEQLTYVVSGALKFTIGTEGTADKESAEGAEGGKEVVVRSGEVLHLPSNVPHAAVALEDTLDVDVFSPPRQDWLNKTDDYLRR